MKTGDYLLLMFAIGICIGLLLIVNSKLDMLLVVRP